MAIGIGIDIGSVSIKAALAGTGEHSQLVESLADTSGFTRVASVPEDTACTLVISDYIRISGNPRNAVDSLLAKILEHIGNIPQVPAFTGSGGRLAATGRDAIIVNEFSAIVESVNLLYPHIRSIFEIGGETSKFILLDKERVNGRRGIVDYGTNGDCAAGTGAFMDQQASRLNYQIEDVGNVVLQAGKAAQIAGRCSVFAKSDMIHAQQRGYQPDEVLKGLCNAVARNFKSVISRGKRIVPPVLFTGGVSNNTGMIHALRDVFELDADELVVTDTACWLGAIGASLKAVEMNAGDAPKRKKTVSASEQFPHAVPLSLENVTLLREQVTPYNLPEGDERVPAYLGIDIGSVSTNLVVIDENGNVIKEIYTRTKARPIEVVGNGLAEIASEIGKRVDIKGVGTTGSGRELIGILVGADTINDEITAHKTGALHISHTMLDGQDVDTIFEIGGQDSKFISIEDGVVVDFTMNDACAAGTGSFLEEQAEELGISIIDEFAEIAMSSDAPIRLGERCTVFMGRDVNAYLQQGAAKEDVIAGLAYSVVQNYLNRVVRDRHVGDYIFFQGGTAYNNAVAAAFAQVSGKQIVVPPHNGVMGAIGAALLAKRTVMRTGKCTSFRGFDLSKVDYMLREFTCKGCSNFCSIQEFTVAGEKTYWGDKCSEKYRKRKSVDKTPVIDDLYKIREAVLRKSFEGNGKARPIVGIPMAMYAYDRLPFFNTYLAECGFCTVLSDPTNTDIANKGIECVTAEPCYPLTVAHGHIRHLLDRGVEYVWLPNMVNVETDTPQYESHVCVWGATLPFVAGHSSSFHPQKHKFLSPTIHFRDGKKVVSRELYEAVKPLGVSKSVSDRALERAYDAQRQFQSDLLRRGVEAIAAVKNSGEKAIVLLGRPYNIYDRAINLSVATKLASVYGINVIPMDFLDVQGIEISDINKNMYWNYGKKILQTCKKLADDPQFDVIYITNFKCGPDSFIKHYIRDAIKRPFLVLQFDGHSNDAGMMTRCEAYLDSKGFLTN